MINDLNTSQPLQFDISKDFELRETIEKKNSANIHDVDNIPSKQIGIEQTEQLDNMVRTLPFINDNIRTNIKLGIEIYKQLNNFDRNYIHTIINGNSIKSD
jgi:hypothetical protein